MDNQTKKFFEEVRKFNNNYKGRITPSNKGPESESFKLIKQYIELMKKKNYATDNEKTLIFLIETFASFHKEEVKDPDLLVNLIITILKTKSKELFPTFKKIIEQYSLIQMNIFTEKYIYPVFKTLFFLSNKEYALCVTNVLRNFKFNLKVHSIYEKVYKFYMSKIDSDFNSSMCSSENTHSPELLFEFIADIALKSDNSNFIEFFYSLIFNNFDVFKSFDFFTVYLKVNFDASIRNLAYFLNNIPEGARKGPLKMIVDMLIQYDFQKFCKEQNFDKYSDFLVNISQYVKTERIFNSFLKVITKSNSMFLSVVSKCLTLHPEYKINNFFRDSMNDQMRLKYVEASFDEPKLFPDNSLLIYYVTPKKIEENSEGNESKPTNYFTKDDEGFLEQIYNNPKFIQNLIEYPILVNFLSGFVPMFNSHTAKKSIKKIIGKVPEGKHKELISRLKALYPKKSHSKSKNKSKKHSSHSQSSEASDTSETSETKAATKTKKKAVVEMLDDDDDESSTNEPSEKVYTIAIDEENSGNVQQNSDNNTIMFSKKVTIREALVEIAKKLGLEEEDIDRIEIFGLSSNADFTQPINKIFFPKNILNVSILSLEAIFLRTATSALKTPAKKVVEDDEPITDFDDEIDPNDVFSKLSAEDIKKLKEENDGDDPTREMVELYLERKNKK